MKPVRVTMDAGDAPTEAPELHAGPGHNSSAAANRLRSFVERVERLAGERDEVNEQIREVLSEAKGEGFDVKAIRIVLRRRRMKAHARREMDEMVELYETTLGSR